MRGQPRVHLTKLTRLESDIIHRWRNSFTESDRSWLTDVVFELARFGPQQFADLDRHGLRVDAVRAAHFNAGERWGRERREQDDSAPGSAASPAGDGGAAKVIQLFRRPTGRDTVAG